MNTEQLIKAEAEIRYPYSSDKVDSAWLAIDREKFIEGATFGASLNGWVKITPETMPTIEDGYFLTLDDNGEWDKASINIKGEIWNNQDEQPSKLYPSYWMKIVKPSDK